MCSGSLREPFLPLGPGSDEAEAEDLNRLLLPLYLFISFLAFLDNDLAWVLPSCGGMYSLAPKSWLAAP